MRKRKIVLAMTALLMLGGTAVYAAAPQIVPQKDHNVSDKIIFSSA
ncbi:hypothetical protein MKY82_28060 [Paenibacillus sp. FSL W7-1279]|nr:MULTISPECIES: hypothetical protein [Paenibacillus]MBX4146351.1 hypothetical protein [Paenibacillus lautus]